ncbi:Ovarian cancer-associated protein 2 [Dinochytrium kinnereticum]|nr:Ovarian cancer-associated protein 2 [Dinochytrium kinnereticum]
MASPSQARHPQRVLCLHGYTQNSDVFRTRTAILRKDLASLAELVYINAPHIVPPSPDQISEVGTAKLSESDRPRSWWTDEDGEHGFREAISLIKRQWEENGPFDGILGFSQGATTAAILGSELSVSAENGTLTSTPPKYLIIVSGFIPAKAGDAAVERWLPTDAHSAVNEGITAPYNFETLHVIGNRDEWVRPERSHALANRYPKSLTSIIEHDGGHFIPTNSEMRKRFKAFISKFASE